MTERDDLETMHLRRLRAKHRRRTEHGIKQPAEVWTLCGLWVKKRKATHYGQRLTVANVCDECVRAHIRYGLHATHAEYGSER